MTPIAIETVTELGDEATRAQLLDLLEDAVESGASVGFTLPFDRAAGGEYWDEVANALAGGAHALVVARQDHCIVGAIQLGGSTKQNGRHRAEMQKLMVLRRARGQGAAKLLVAALEALAPLRGVSLIILDTKVGDTAEGLYAKLGYVRFGVVPNYAMDGDGGFSDTAFFYKLLSP